MRKNWKSVFFVVLLAVILFSFASVASADTLTLPSSLKQIEAEAFMGNTSLDEVILPEGLESIGEKAFANSGVQRIYLPESLTDIAGDAFAGCTNVVGYGPDNTTASSFFDSHAGLTFERADEWVSSPVEDFTFSDNGDGTCSISGYTGNDVNIVIPNKNAAGLPVTKIGDQSFYQNNVIQKVRIPNTVKVIDGWAFAECTSLKEIEIPDSVTVIDYCAFFACEKLESIQLPSSLTTLGAHALRDCKKIVSISIPSGVTQIQDGTFWDCGALEEIIIPETVTYIGESAFVNCLSLREITLPSSIKAIMKQTFYLCNALTNVKIPAGLTRIEEEAFRDCSSLAEITLPEFISVIGANAFDTNTVIRVKACSTTEATLAAAGYSYSLIEVTENNELKPAVTAENTDCYRVSWTAVSGVINYTVKAYLDSACTTLYSLIESTGNNASLNGEPGERYYFTVEYEKNGKIEKSAAVTTDPLLALAAPANLTGTMDEDGSTLHLTWDAVPNAQGYRVYCASEDVWTQNTYYAFVETTSYDGYTVQLGQCSYFWVRACASGQWDPGLITEPFVCDRTDEVDTPVDGFTFSDNWDGTCTVTGYTGIDSEIVIPDKNADGLIVTSIGDFAFCNCSNLVSIIIPDCVEQIGYGAFVNCSNLTSIFIPRSVIRIDTGYLFDGCNKLTEINVASENTEYASQDGVLFSKDKTTLLCCPGGKTGLYEIPVGVTGIGFGAFDGCSNLERIIIPKSVTRIYLGSYSFDGCNKLTEITVVSENTEYSSQDGVLFNKDKTTLLCCPGGKTGLYEIPFGVTSIGSGAFAYCADLTGITIPESVTSIGRVAFEGCDSLNTILIPDSVNSIDYGAFICSNLISIDVASQNANYASQDGVLFNKGKTTVICYPHGKAGSYSIPNGVTSIGNSAFELCFGLTGITIPNSVISIGEFAFGFCDNLTSIIIPNGVTSIGDSAFFMCNSLSTFTVPDSVTSIGGSAFAYCSNLADITIPDGMAEIGDDAFNGCYSLTDIYYGGSEEQWTTICGDNNDLPYRTVVHYYGFRWTLEQGVLTVFGTGPMEESIPWDIRDSVQSVIIKNGVTSISDHAFSYCSGLTSITIPNSVTQIGYYAFAYCSGLTGCLTIPGNVTSIDEGAFRGCSGLSSLFIENGVTRIGYEAFDDCSGLIGAYIPLSVSSIDSCAFISYYNPYSYNNDFVIYGITGSYAETYANEQNYPFSDLEIDPEAKLGGTFLEKEIAIKLGRMRQLAGIVSSFGSDIKYITLTIDGYQLEDDENDRYIYDDFSNHHLKKVSLQYWPAFTLDTTREPLNVPGTYTINLWANTVENTIGIKLDTMLVTVTEEWISSPVEDFTFSQKGDGICEVTGYNGNDTEIIIPEKNENGLIVTSIGDRAFYECRNVASIEIPDSITSIGKYAFLNCINLTRISIPNCVTNIGKWAFQNCVSITDISIPNSTIIIEEGTFYNCEAMRNISIPNSITSIGGLAFWGCRNMVNIIIPNSITSIGDAAFGGCNSLITISIPNSVITIGEYAFEYCDNLSYISIPNSVIRIEDSTFCLCNSLSRISIPDSVIFISGSAFDNCCEELIIYGIAASYAETYAKEHNIPFSTDPMPGLETEPETVTVSGTVHTASGEPIPGVYVLLYDYNTSLLPIDATYSNAFGEWMFEGMDTLRQYSVTFSSEQFTFSPTAVDVTFGKAVETIAEEKMIDQLYGASFAIHQNGQPVEEIQVGTIVSFQVEVEGMTSVQLVADGTAYEEYAVHNGTVSFDRVITKGGSRKIHFLCKQEGVIAGKTEEKILTVNSEGNLDSPVISTNTTGTAGQSHSLTWQTVEHAERYTVYLYHQSFLLMRWTIQASTTSLTIPGDYLYENGIYALEIIASGENYSQSSGFAEITVNRNPAALSAEGRFLNDKGEAIVDVSIALVKDTLGKIDYISSTKTDADGVFRFEKLTPNCDYTILYEKPGYEFTTNQYDIKPGEKNIMISGTSMGDGPLYLSAKGITHWNQANTQTVTVYSPYDWNASADESWFTFIIDGNELSVTMLANDTGEDRQSSVLITSADYSVILPVSQQSGEELDFSKTRAIVSQYVLEKDEAYKDLNFLFGKGAVTHTFLMFGYKPKDSIKSYWKILTGDTKKMTADEIIKAKKELIILTESRSALLANGVLTDQQRTYCLSVVNNYAKENYMNNDDLKSMLKDIIDNVDLDADLLSDIPVFDKCPDYLDVETWNAVGAGIALTKDIRIRTSAEYMVRCLHGDSDGIMRMIDEGQYIIHSDVGATLSMKEVERFCNIIMQYKRDVESN